MPRPRNTSAAILAAAAQLFDGVPPSRVRVEDIAAKAGTSVGSVYVHFKSKDALYLHVVDRALQRSRQMPATGAGHASPIERVIAAGEAYLEFALTFPGALRVLEEHRSGASRVEIPAGIEDRIQSRVDEEVALVRGNLERAMVTHEIESFPVDDLLLALWASWDGIIRMSLSDDNPRLEQADLRRILGGAARIVVRGMRPED